VLAIRGHAVESIGNGDDAGKQGDIITRQPAGIPSAVEPFVMMQDDFFAFSQKVE